MSAPQRVRVRVRHRCAGCWRWWCLGNDSSSSSYPARCWPLESLCLMSRKWPRDTSKPHNAAARHALWLLDMNLELCLSTLHNKDTRASELTKPVCAVWTKYKKKMAKLAQKQEWIGCRMLSKLRYSCGKWDVISQEISKLYMYICQLKQSVLLSNRNIHDWTKKT